MAENFRAQTEAQPQHKVPTSAGVTTLRTPKERRGRDSPLRAKAALSCLVPFTHKPLFCSELRILAIVRSTIQTLPDDCKCVARRAQNVHKQDSGGAACRAFDESPTSTSLTGFEEMHDTLANPLAPRYLALPYHEYPPAESTQFRPIASIPGLISFKLVPPELPACAGQHAAVAAVVAVPEATVHEDHSHAARKNEIRFPRQMPNMQAIAVPQSVDEPPDHHLRCRILASDPRHAESTLCWREDINHLF